jgi:hypothetical protein
MHMCWFVRFSAVEPNPEPPNAQNGRHEPMLSFLSAHDHCNPTPRNLNLELRIRGQPMPALVSFRHSQPFTFTAIEKMAQERTGKSDLPSIVIDMAIANCCAMGIRSIEKAKEDAGAEQVKHQS